MEEQTTEQVEQEPKAGEPTVIESLVEHVETYTRTTVDLAKLRVVQKASEILSKIAMTVLLIVLSLLVLVFVSVGAALWIGELLGSAFYGFFIVAGFYLVLALLLYLLRDRIVKKPVSDAIIDHFID
jgi:hypothetical protein